MEEESVCSVCFMLVCSAILGCRCPLHCEFECGAVLRCVCVEEMPQKGQGQGQGQENGQREE